MSRPAEAAPRRTASGVPIVPALEGFRAWAIAGVVALHLIAISGALAALGRSAGGVLIWGVFGNVIEVFFIISGFVLFLPVVVRGGDLGPIRRFAIGRAARLLPAYWLALAVVLALIAIHPLDPPPTVLLQSVTFPGVGDIAIHVAALQMPARMLDGSSLIGFGVDGPLWMISVIVGFYFVFPLVARGYYRHPLIGLAAAAAITLAWKEAALHATGLFESIEGGGSPGWVVELIAVDQLPAWAFSFALGMTGAMVYVRLESGARDGSLVRPATIVAVGAAVACCVCAFVYGRAATEVTAAFQGSLARTDVLLGLAYSIARATVIVAIALGPAWMQAPFANRPLRAVADLSYGVYLIHIPVAIYVGAVVIGLPTDGTLGATAAWFAVVIPISVAYAVGSRRLVEEPATRRARRVTARARPAPGGGVFAGP